ncbi:MAG TPA: GNAT family N-acetyltransferase [Gemmatimonadales bacterium]|nr:GNAT family N-acetyltransferase [Gemmatimonadales bacterium]
MAGRISSLDAFTTRRMRAERLRPDHHADLRRMDTDARMMATLGGIRDPAGTAEYLARNLEHWAEHGFGIWMLRDVDTGSVMGRAVLRHLEINGVDEVEVGYGFLPEFWGRGLATEIARACVRIGLEALRLPSLIAITLTTNFGSRRVLEKAGLLYQRDMLHAGLPHALFRIVNQGAAQ